MSRVFAKSRLINESIKDSWNIHGIQYFDTENLIFIPIYDKFKDDYCIMTVKIIQQYPWRPPDVFYNGKDLITYYGELNNKLSHYKDFEKITSKKCLCCSTILCSNNWSVGNHIMHIKNEFQKIYNLPLRIYQRFWAKRIASRLLVEDIPLHEFL